MIHKTKAFADADKDEDGKLSFEEMVDGVKAELGAAR
jgi:Ca2+-binding EF-hand superfamily protein